MNNIVNNNYSNPNFKAVYPVVHWVSDGGKYFRASGKMSKEIQGRVIRILNRMDVKKKKILSPDEQNLKSFIEQFDVDYRILPVVRSFYNKVASKLDNASQFVSSELIYIISGKSVGDFNSKFAKNIGRAKSGKYPELNVTEDGAKQYYNEAGYSDYVQDYNKRLKDRNGNLQTLNAAFKIIRNKSGKITGYKFVGAKFLPDKY